MRLILLMVISMLTVSIASAVTMIWDYVDNPLQPAVSFSVYKDNACTGALMFIASVPRPTQEYTDNNVVAGGRYCYQVTAIGSDGQESSASNTLSFQVPLPPPNTPSNLRVK